MFSIAEWTDRASALSYPKKLTSSASFSPSIRISLRLKIHQAQVKNFCRVLDIRVSQVMKSQMLQSCILQNFLVDVDHRIWMIHLACFWGWEHPRIAGMLLVFCDQQIDGILWDGDFSDRVFRFRARDVRLACVVASGLLADGNRFVLNVQIRPLERHQFAFAQAADEFQIEHRQDTALLCCG